MPFDLAVCLIFCFDTMIRSNLFRVNIKVLPQHIIVASGFKQCTTLVCDENVLYILRYNLAYIHNVKMKTQLVVDFRAMKYLKVS